MYLAYEASDIADCNKGFIGLTNDSKHAAAHLTATWPNFVKRLNNSKIEIFCSMNENNLDLVQTNVSRLRGISWSRTVRGYVRMDLTPWHMYWNHLGHNNTKVFLTFGILLLTDVLSTVCRSNGSPVLSGYHWDVAALIRNLPWFKSNDINRSNQLWLWYYDVTRGTFVIWAVPLIAIYFQFKNIFQYSN